LQREVVGTTSLARRALKAVLAVVVAAVVEVVVLALIV